MENSKIVVHPNSLPGQKINMPQEPQETTIQRAIREAVETAAPGGLVLTVPKL